MTRMFIKHEPVNAYITVYTKPNPEDTRIRFRLEAMHVTGIDNWHICFVHEGVCYAARSRSLPSSGFLVTILAIPFDDKHLSNLMLLKDTLLK